MKEKYGEITMLDFPQFTKDTFTGVTHMDLFSGLFGDVTDDSMFAQRTFDPSSASGKKWLDKLVAKMVATGTKVGLYTLGAGQTASKPASFDYFHLSTAAVDTTTTPSGRSMADGPGGGAPPSR